MSNTQGMNCPSCNVNLIMSERQGIEIDYCPQCRGVWLDRGELDKIIERSTAETRPEAQLRQPEQYSSGFPNQRGEYRKKKRKSFFEELFD